TARVPALTWREAHAQAAAPPRQGLPARRPRLRGRRGGERDPDRRAARPRGEAREGEGRPEAEARPAVGPRARHARGAAAVLAARAEARRPDGRRDAPRLP